MKTPDVEHSIVRAFKQLQTSCSRIEALDALTAELTCYEWRALQSKLDTRDFRFDIVGTLPAELVASIFCHVDVSTPYRLQRVSKRWHHLLSSPAILERSLKNWDDTTKYGSSDYALCRRKARNIHRFRTGAAVDHKKTFWESASYKHKLTNIVDALVEETFIWLQPGRRTLNVCNLRTMTEFHLHGDAREIITNVALSNDLIAFSTSLNTCHVTTSDGVGGNRKKFKLAQDMFQQLTCRGRTIACGGFVNSSAVIYIWNFDTQSGRSFEVGTQDLPFASRISTCVAERNLALLPDPHTKTIAVFASDRCYQRMKAGALCEHAEPRCSIHYSSFTFDGERLRDNQVSLPGLTGLYLRGFHLAGSQGHLALSAITRTSISTGDTKVSFKFDERLNEFVHVNCPTPSSHVWVSEEVAWWNDTFFQIVPRNTKGRHGMTLLAHLGTSGPPQKILPQIYEDPTPRHQHGTPRLFVNDKFVVVMNMTEYEEPDSHVLCFNDEYKFAT